MTVPELIITRYTRNAGFRVLHNHVNVIHPVHMQVGVCLVGTERELMLNQSMATVPTHGRSNGRGQN